MPVPIPNSLDHIDLAAHSEPQLSSLDINLDRPISLKKLTRQATRELERKIILKVLQAHHGNRKKAAVTHITACGDAAHFEASSILEQ
jgi:DNA-binding NtrC family response regulator